MWGILILLDALYFSSLLKPAVIADPHFSPPAANPIDVFIVVACRHNGVARQRKVVAKASPLSVKVKNVERLCPNVLT